LVGKESPRKQNLPKEEKEYNKSHYKRRIVVEHIICRLKKYRIMSDIFRNRLKKYDKVSDIVSSLPYVLYMIADQGYDDNNLYKYSKKVLGIDLVCPVERYESTPKEWLELVCFYE
jgi:hypothetical protein